MKNKIGRPAYQENIKQLKQLFKQVNNGEITNQEGWHKARLSAKRNGMN